MELKLYQKQVIGDLSCFLALLTELESAPKAYLQLWTDKGVQVGLGGLPYYQSRIGDIPEVCLKVPTGGGKTFIAANAVKTIFDAMPGERCKAVVWLVPSDAILSQTYKALDDSYHPYRQRLDVDFSGQVEVYSKEQLLNGQNFRPDIVAEQLSVFVLSYDSFRTSRKDGRKSFQENGYLADFAKRIGDKSMLLPDADETALIQVVRSLNPVVIVDESHHATSSLSLDMLRNFNPCFVLNLTATPKAGSNIISFVDAVQLKKANMVKLPVIVYNRKSQEDVYYDAIAIRRKLEAQAKKEQAVSGRYIRPIVLFQAQPRNSEDSTTYDKIKNTLIEAGIPKEHIAIKTGDRDEIKNINLMSPDCEIRYIITVNALKEGWDCPFAYVLATVANRTSVVDVEQILGRVLRLPYTQRNASDVLNLSYVITSSANFNQTLEKVVAGLNNAGFSSKDCRAEDIEPELDIPAVPAPEQMRLPDVAAEQDDVPTIDAASLKARIEAAQQMEEDAEESIGKDELFSVALAQNEAYEAEAAVTEETAYNLAPQEVRDKMNVFHINAELREEALSLLFPQFMLQAGYSLFSESEYVKLELEHLTKGFTLKDKDVQIDFSTVDAEIASVDVEEKEAALPKAWKLTGPEGAYLKEWFASQPPQVRLKHCKDLIHKTLSKMDCMNDKELRAYIDRAIDTLTADQLVDLEQSPHLYIKKIESKVKDLLAIHRAKTFDLWLQQGSIVCRPNYQLPPTISPARYTSIIPHSLYEGEEAMDEYEQNIAYALSGLPNIKWWHRNISLRGFQINGYVHAYPDFIAMTMKGRILMIEPKGDFLDNDESKIKAKIGHQWANLSGDNYRYFMVYKTNSPDYFGACSYDRFMEIVKGL